MDQEMRKNNERDEMEIDPIKSEISELESILAGLPKENVIERMGFEARLQSLKGK